MRDHPPEAVTHIHPHPHQVAPVGPPVGWVPVPEEESRGYRFMKAIWTRPSWLAPLAIFGCIFAACTYVLTNNPTDARPDPLGPCLFKTLTGLDCPGCGGTRMVWYLLHGDVWQAARHHLIALIAVPVVLYAYFAWGAKRLLGVTLPTKRIPPIVWGSYLVAWLAFSVLRNLPWMPFHYFYVR